MATMKPIRPLEALRLDQTAPNRVFHTPTEALARLMSDTAYVLAAEVRDADPMLAVRLAALEDELEADGVRDRRMDEFDADQMKVYDDACAAFQALGLRGLATYWESCPSDCAICQAQQG